ncbi:hypothetical protein ACQP00_50335 [Dactylosporangium sp. CS-047395]|uniref:hypothetical protein n=1 Tax=Dactylosporangium sp. CS-047395 TaxID=3239936 RepID=UPI003D92098F
MGVLHGLLVAGVIGLIAVAPCFVCVLLMSGGEAIPHGWERVRRRLPKRARARLDERTRRRRAEEPRTKWRIGRAPREGDESKEDGRLVGPPIEQVAGDLRRLNRLRESVATRSRVWFVAVQEAYDEGLHTACAQLDIEQHLDEVAGIDRELERLRVEGELQRAGLVLRKEIGSGNSV